jgi:molecular chaperone DnaK
MATYGIDLGTTNSCIAYVDKTLRPVVLKNSVDEDTTPSVVFFESPGHVVVGRQAKNSALLAPKLVRELVKRDMGQDVHYEYHGQDYTPESVSALILRALADAAREKTGEAVEDVVITVPAYFGLRERVATRKAGEIAGLNVLDVLPEPVAAALAYQSIGEDAATRHLFVYDLGGGTFDTTVIRLDGNDVEILCVDGNHQLGGADWDKKIVDFLLQGFTDQYPQLDPGGDEQFMQDLANSAEDLKKALSSVQARPYNVRFDGSVVPLELTRERLEELTSELLEQTMEITDRTIAMARDRGVERFDDVLLVGGMTSTPAISRMLRERFELEGRRQDPNLAVAKGAALFALTRKIRVTLGGDGGDIRALSEEYGDDAQGLRQIAEIKVAGMTPRAFGLKVTDSRDPLFGIDPTRARAYITHLLAANTPLPADTGWHTFETVEPNQRRASLEVWEQAGAVASEELQYNNSIGQGTLSDLPPRPARTPFEVQFHMTETGTLQVHGRESSGSEVRFEVQIGGLDEKTTNQAMAQIAAIEVTS